MLTWSDFITLIFQRSVQFVVNFLAVDWGTKYIGLAFADSSTCIPVPLEVLQRNPWRLARSRLKELCDSYKVRRIVIGWPCNPDGGLTKRCGLVSSAIDLLKTAGCPEVAKQNEQGSSQAGIYMYKGLGFNYTDKRRIDQYAAVKILADYLETVAGD